MRTPLALAAVATAIVGLGSPALSPASGATTPAASTSAATAETSRERGVVIDCTGTYRGEEVYVSVYENDTYANVFQVVVGEDGGASRESARGFVEKKQVRATLRLDGRKVLVSGTAKPFGTKVAVHEEHDDAGQHIVVDGFHRKLRTDLTMRWKGRTADLTCEDAFRYDLQVTTTDTTGD